MQNFHHRSDHYNCIRRGVPALFLFNGPHADDHRASDQAGKIDVARAARIAVSMFYPGLEVANTQARPVMTEAVP